MNIDRQITGRLTPPLVRQDSVEDTAWSEDLERSIDATTNGWGVAASQLLAPRRNSFNAQRSIQPVFGSPPRQPGYLQAVVPRPLLQPPQAVVRRAYSAVVIGAPPAHPINTPDIKAHRQGLDSHGRIIASNVQSSANALLGAYGPKTDVDAAIARLNQYLQSYASRWPGKPLAQRRANGAQSPIDDARAFMLSTSQYALNHKDNAHFYLDGHAGQPPGVPMRRLCAIAWHCAETWADPTCNIAPQQGRALLQEAIARALADFTLEASVSGDFRCTSGQLTLLMRALQKWIPEVLVDVVAPDTNTLLEPPTANEFVLLFCYNLEVISRGTPASEQVLREKAADAMVQVQKLYAARENCAAVMANVAQQIASYYETTFNIVLPKACREG